MSESPGHPPHWREEAWSLTNRLRLRYPVGPRLASGEPEFGWRVMEPLSPYGHPGIQLEAAHRIEELEAQLAAFTNQPKDTL